MATKEKVWRKGSEYFHDHCFYEYEPREGYTEVTSFPDDELCSSCSEPLVDEDEDEDFEDEDDEDDEVDDDEDE